MATLQAILSQNLPPDLDISPLLGELEQFVNQRTTSSTADGHDDVNGEDGGSLESSTPDKAFTFQTKEVRASHLDG